jgi:N-acetylglutamate synthase-like GNAT family acetyltransferase
MSNPEIRPCEERDIEIIYEIINDAAQAYRGIIPTDRWKEPYMSKDELRHEIDEGVRFWGYIENGELLGVMGMQNIENVILVRHAYVRTVRQNQGIGGSLLSELRKKTRRQILVGTWAAAAWAVRFYKAHGFCLVSPEEKDRLLKQYWSIPERQIETSVVLVERRSFDIRGEKT